MSVKQFKLPKEFAENWVKELRSGKYTQIDGSLYKEECNGFCCLGVAGKLLGGSVLSMSYSTYLGSNVNVKTPIPAELYEFTTTVHILSSLNDGVTRGGSVVKTEEFKNSVFRHGDPQQHFAANLGEYKLNFSQIADFIEDNFELY